MLKLQDLQEGRFIRNREQEEGFQIVGNYGDRVIAIRAYHISNPPEWRVRGTTFEKVADLKPGDIITHVSSPFPAYVITSVHGNRAVAVQTREITESTLHEWESIE